MWGMEVKFYCLLKGVSVELHLFRLSQGSIESLHSAAIPALDHREKSRRKLGEARYRIKSRRYISTIYPKR